MTANDNAQSQFDESGTASGADPRASEVAPPSISSCTPPAESAELIQARYQRLLEASRDVFLELRASDGLVLEISPSIQQVSGHTRDELLGLPFSDLCRRAREFKKFLDAVKQSGKRDDYELTLLGNRKQKVPCLLSARVCADHAATPILCGLLRPITDHEQIERDLRESEERYRNLVALAPDSIATLDLRGRITSTNAAACGLTGYENDEVVGKPFWKIGCFRASDIPKYLKLFYTLVRGKPSPPIELECLSKDGTPEVLESHFALIKKNNRIVGLQIISRNITGRKQAEEALRESESQFRALFENALDAMFLTLPDGTICAANPAACVLFERTEEELCRAGRAQIVDVTDPRLASGLERRARTGKVFTELYCLRRDGSRFTAEVGSVILAGQPQHSFVVIRDISERKRAEMALQESEARNRLLIETMPQLAWRTSADGLEVECNRRWYEYTGQTPEQVSGHGWLAPIHPDDLFRVCQAALHAGNVAKPYEVEYRLRRASDGSYRWHLARAVPVFSENGAIISWIGSATDIEELKQAQDVLRKDRDEQLQRHRAELAHVGRVSMVGELAAGLAHELNQPLHAITNYARGSVRRITKCAEPDPELTAALEQISDEANRAAEIVRRVRRFVEKREPQFSEVSLRKLIEEVLLLNEAAYKEHPLLIQVAHSEDVPPVPADAIQIQQVLMNLIRNGIEAMADTPEAERTLKIVSTRHGHTVQVSVSDRGKGMSPQDLERVFEPFYTTKPDGMGMGLAISRSIVQAHGGRLWATENHDRGSTFHFTLPIAKRT